MGAVSYTVTLPATPVAQNLGTLCFAGSDDTRIGGKYDVPLREISFQALKANTTDVFVGADFVVNGVAQGPLVSSTKHGFRVDSTDSAPPIIFGSYDSGGSKISDFWVIGASGNEVLCVMGQTF